MARRRLDDRDPGQFVASLSPVCPVSVNTFSIVQLYLMPSTSQTFT